MNKKGFTLIELLAVIIILGLIAVITIPKLNKQLDQSKKSLAEDSALKYKKSIDEYVLRQEMNKNKIALEGTYNIDENGYLYNEETTHEISFSGTKPANGTLQYINDELQSGCITINKYKVTFTNGEISNTEKGTCEFASNNNAKQAVISAKVDSYVKNALQANQSIAYDETYTVAEMSGVTTNQADSGWIQFKKENSTVTVIDYSLTYGDLTANYSSLTNGNYVSTFGDARNKPGTVALGSDVCLTETDCFKVIEINGETVTLLANNNINTSTGMQGANGQSYTVAFSQTDYWMDTTTSPNTLKSAYSNNGAYSYDSANNIFVDTNNNKVYPDIYDPENYAGTPGTNTYSVAYYIEQYVEKLQDLGLSVTSGRILKKSEVEPGGMASSYKISGEDYWLGSASINSNGSYVKGVDRSNNNIYGYTYSIISVNGVRPVIVISKSDI